MKAADLTKAALIADAREKNVAIRDRLAAGERLTLSLGDGGTAQTIVLMPAYVARIRSDLLAAFDTRIAENDHALAETRDNAMTVAMRRSLTPPPLHIALPGNLAEEVRELAEARGDHPQAMVAQLVRRVLDGDMVAGLLAPQVDVPAPEPVGQGRMAFQNVSGTLTELQCGVIYVLGFHADSDGVFRFQATKIGLILGKGSQNHVASILTVLAERGLVEQVSGRLKNRHWKLTWRGQSVFRELTEERE